MTKLTIVANITANTDKVNLVKSELLKLIEPTLAEDGCMNYDLHTDNENPAHFMFYENWDTREHWLQHMESQHLKDYISNTEGAIAELTVHEMSLIK